MRELEQELARRLDAAAVKRLPERREEVLEALGSTVRQAFGLRPDEIAILILSRDRSTLQFVYPAGMAEGGSNAFPVSVPSLAGQVVQTGRSVLNNAVHEVPHLGFYERIRVMENAPLDIQKLLVVAVKGADGAPQAVIEVSRRGRSRAEASPDFRPEDQQLLERLAAAASPALTEAFATGRQG